MPHKAVLVLSIILPGLVVALLLGTGCTRLQKPKLPEKLAGKFPTPSRSFEQLQQLLRAEQFGEAYTRFSPQYYERYAPDLETFRARAEVDAAKIATGRLAEPARLTGNVASAVLEYGDEFISIYFIFDPSSRLWLVTSQEHYRFLTEKGDQSSPEATLQSFLRFLISNRARPAYRLLATEFTLKNGVIKTQRFMRNAARVFQPRKGGKSWRIKHSRRGRTWAAFVIEFPDRPMMLCFVKKLDNWYLAVEPLGDAASAIPFLKECRKLYAPKQKKDDGKTETDK